jgi:hypothetical protein
MRNLTKALIAVFGLLLPVACGYSQSAAPAAPTASVGSPIVASAVKPAAVPAEAIDIADAAIIVRPQYFRIAGWQPGPLGVRHDAAKERVVDVVLSEMTSSLPRVIAILDVPSLSCQTSSPINLVADDGTKSPCVIVSFTGSPGASLRVMITFVVPRDTTKLAVVVESRSPIDLPQVPGASGSLSTGGAVPGQTSTPARTPSPPPAAQASPQATGATTNRPSASASPTLPLDLAFSFAQMRLLAIGSHPDNYPPGECRSGAPCDRPQDGMTLLVLKVGLREGASPTQRGIGLQGAFLQMILDPNRAPYVLVDQGRRISARERQATFADTEGYLVMFDVPLTAKTVTLVWPGNPDADVTAYVQATASQVEAQRPAPQTSPTPMPSTAPATGAHKPQVSAPGASSPQKPLPADIEVRRPYTPGGNVVQLPPSHEYLVIFGFPPREQSSGTPKPGGAQEVCGMLRASDGSTYTAGSIAIEVVPGGRAKTGCLFAVATTARGLVWELPGAGAFEL